MAVAAVLPGRGTAECHSLSGEKCVFPFRWDGKTFNKCTTYKSENGAAWCKTVRGRLEDCSVPCGAGTSPGRNCPRSPVVQRLSLNCCTPEQPCRAGEGDCGKDADCHGDLKCGDANCGRFRQDNYKRADCCYDPYDQPDYATGKVITITILVILFLFLHMFLIHPTFSAKKHLSEAISRNMCSTI
jgi:hypothetical protein